MRWSVHYRARWHHCWREQTPKGKGKGKVTAHAAIPHDWGTVIEIDPGAWVRGLRAKLDRALNDPQDETAVLELLEIYSLTPMDAEAEKARSYWTAVFEAEPERRQVH